MISEIYVTEGDKIEDQAIHWTIPGCDPLKLGARPAPNAEWIGLVDKATKSIDRLEQIRVVLGSIPRTTLTIDTANYLRWERGEKGLTLGFGWFDAVGTVEKSLLSYWVERVSPDRNALVREVFVDQLWGLLNGDLSHEFPDMENRVEYKNFDQKVAAFALPAFNYCQTPYIMLRQLPWCKKKALKYADAEMKDLSIWALRPVISSWLFDHIQDQPAPEKVAFFQRWMKSIRKNTTDEWRYTQPETQSQFIRTYAEAKKYFEGILDLNFNEIPTELEKITTLIDLRDEKLEVKFQNPMVFQKIAFTRGNLRWMDPTWSKVEIAENDARFKDERVKTLVILDCVLPKASSLVNEYSVKADNLIFIKSCEGSAQELITQFIRDPIETVLVRNDKLEFVQFHLPSLAMAINLHGRAIENPANWKNLLGWQQTRRAFRETAEQPMAAIEAVRYFRWNFSNKKI